MKFVHISGGLGNQMFCYAFCLELRKRGEESVLLITKGRQSKAYNQGYELDRIFKIKKYQGLFSFVRSYILIIYLQLLRVIPKTYRQIFIRASGIKIITVKENFIFYPDVFSFKRKDEYFLGTWHSHKYFIRAINEVRKSYIFNTNLISTQTRQIYEYISQVNSVSIHIRRGDYLSDKYIKGFGKICDDEYYKTAIDYIKSKINNIFLFIFTDDKEWVFDNFKLENSYLIGFNKGTESWQDMFLMSKCRHNIIANSSFSWWGAWLNDNPGKIVIAPKRWWNSIEIDDVVPKDWIRL